MEMEPIASKMTLPVILVNPILVVAIKIPANAALSSNNTATALGSRPRDT